MEARQRQFSLWYLAFTFLAILAIQSYLTPHVESLSYSSFKALLRAGKIEDVALTETRITGTLLNEGLDELLPPEELEPLRTFEPGPHPFATVRVSDPDLVPQLEAANVRFSGRIDSNWIGTLLSWVLPAVVFFGLWSLLMRRMGGAAGGMLEIGKSKAKIYVEKDTKVTFDDVAGVDEAKEELEEIVRFLKDASRYGRLGARMPRGVLLVGPPGTGKTLIARAVAGEAGVPFLSISGSEFVEMFVGVGAARVRDLFQQARSKAPAIIFIDRSIGIACRHPAWGPPVLEPVEREVHIVGAGPAGLGAATALGRRGRRPVVHERQQGVGERFNGDFQGIESWSSRRDALEDLREMGLPIERLPVTPFQTMELWAGRRGPFRIETRRPLFYLVRRGPEKDTLDSALLEAALEAGAEIRFGEDLSELPPGGLVAGGPHAADVIAEGLAFRWEGADLAVAVVDPDLAPGGYAYLLRHGGRATLVTVLWRDFRSIHERLDRTQAWFEERYAVRPEEPHRFGGFGNFAPELPAVRNGRLYLGESAGLQDFLWGFGMRYALRSAELAARAIAHEKDPARAYAAAVQRTLGPMLRASLVNRTLFEWLEGRNALPRLVPLLARRDPHRLLRLAFNEGPLRRLLVPWLVRRHRSRLVDRRCHDEGCTCVWCRHGRGQGRGRGS